MLYQLYEAQRSLMEPFSDFAQAASRLYGPGAVWSQLPMAQRMAAGYDLLYRLGKDYEKPEFNIKGVKVDGDEVVIQEVIELDRPFCQLRRFKRFTDEPHTLQTLKGQPVVLIVAPLSGHYATLLRDTVRTMLQDHKVYITDWKNARLVPLSEGTFHLDDYINYVQEFIRHLQAEYGNCHVVSVCQPTVPVLAAVSLMASRGEALPLSMTMMGGPIDARKSPTAVNNLAMNKSYEWFENNVIYRVPQGFAGAGRRVYPGFLQHTGFVAMNPDRHATSHYDYFKDLIKGDDASVEAHRKFYDEYNAVLDMDADYYLDTIRTVFQDFDLVNGTWDVKNPQGQIERVKPQDIHGSALLTIEGELDDISGSGQTEAAHQLCTGIPAAQREHYEVKGAGHYGIFSGRRWRDMVYPKTLAFIAAHDKPQKRAPSNKGVTAEDTIRAMPAKPKALTAPAPRAKVAAARKTTTTRSRAAR
ncbi:polyhydroxyalkanoate depolymerase [Variovorax sp. J22G21]|uniref:polyhydroxyalkanoate depolymerase n=1 Tax=Variovorax fucosicus TaxID=3053517 RepID=UPI0025765CA0|nr:MULTISPECIES: polyhydroxyalkanoate depolymerase [unclassified Variovorax]MDM0041909.1 polyhydroxyalkanoate depolymerase [Variovorax sp. J22R193]MDM0056989.1 polyhydroxyalkanoate depolymerase [Variovorax sp. J22G47]MDM0059679.1 polyhydroxyalkanoate depolymerase [Variovorax sp. J22G21]